MKHGIATIVMLAVTVAMQVGCSQPVHLYDCEDFSHRVGVPPDIATNPHLSDEVVSAPTAAPADINYPERQPYYLTLQEAIAMALERGSTGLQTTRNFGLPDDDLIIFNQLGSQLGFGDSIRVLALSPAILGTNIEANLARYDAVGRFVLGASSRDFPTNSSQAFQNGQFGQFGLSLEKAMPSGGSGSIIFGSPPNEGINTTNIYSRFAQQNFFTNALNPQYTPTLTFAFDQPLLWGFGPDINSLLAQHPETQNGIGAQTQMHTNELTQNGIVIARLQFDETRADFERSVNFMLANVEVAYWNLYGAFVSLFSSEQALRQAYAAWAFNEKRFAAGTIPITQFAQIRGQYEQFRGDRLVALGQVLEAERVLRSLVGLPMEDGKRLVPVDTPTVAPYVPDWCRAYDECLRLRPELVLQRLDLKQRQLELIREKNSLLPDVRLGANYNIHGAGSELDGNNQFNGETSNALRSLASDHFNDFTVGIFGAVPIGFRAQNAAVRAAKLRLAQDYLQLRDQESRAVRFLTQQYRAVIQNYAVIQARHQQREAFAVQVENRFKEFQAGKTTADFLLQAQRDWANAVNSEYQAIVEYNNSLVKFQFAKGTLMQYDHVQIAEGEVPECVQVRAVENERQRSQALALREEAFRFHEFPSGNPILPENCVAPVPTLMQSGPDLNKMDEAMSATPRPVNPVPPPPPSTGVASKMPGSIPPPPVVPSVPTTTGMAPKTPASTPPPPMVAPPPMVPPAPTTLPAPSRVLAPSTSINPPTLPPPPPSVTDDNLRSLR
jgi:outer membrane protein TolC